MHPDIFPIHSRRFVARKLGAFKFPQIPQAIIYVLVSACSCGMWERICNSLSFSLQSIKIWFNLREKTINERLNGPILLHLTCRAHRRKQARYARIARAKPVEWRLMWKQPPTIPSKGGSCVRLSMSEGVSNLVWHPLAYKVCSVSSCSKVILYSYIDRVNISTSQ